MHRLFAAIIPPADVSAALVGIMGGIETARWQTAGQLHVTLAFVGEIERHAANRVAEALHHVHSPALDLRIADAGVFEAARGGRIGTLYAGVAGAGLEALARRAQQCCRHAGVMPDGRRFVPHITLARFPSAGVMVEAVQPWLANPLPRIGWKAESFWLVESRLGRGGSHYEPIVEYPLKGNSADQRPR